MRFLYVNFKIFSKISNLNGYFAKTRKNLSLCLLISFKIIKAFQNSIKIALIFIKICFLSQNSLKFHEKFQNFAVFHWFFGYFFIFSLASGGSAARTPYKSIFPKFSKFFLNFRENFDNIFKKFQNIAKFPYKFSKNYIIFIDFLTFFENFRVWKNAKFLISPM